jgi:hypothetical protein
MNNFKVNRAATAYNNGNTWEVVDTRTNEVVRTCSKGGDAAAFVRFYEAELVKSNKLWEI